MTTLVAVGAILLKEELGAAHAAAHEDDGLAVIRIAITGQAVLADRALADAIFLSLFFGKDSSNEESNAEDGLHHLGCAKQINKNDKRDTHNMRCHLIF